MMMFGLVYPNMGYAGPGPFTFDAVAATTVNTGVDGSWGGAADWMDVAVSILASAVIVVLAVRRPAADGLKWFAISLSLFLTARYLIWRGMYTLNTSDPVSMGMSLAVFGAEIYGFGGVVLFLFQIIKPLHRDPKPMGWSVVPSVDVFVTIYDEPVDILRRTLVACRAIDYPVDQLRLYVLDDGARSEVRKLAARLGCVYLARSGREHAKAGNLNFALAHSSGDLVAVFDTDHVPAAAFLTETVGHFDSPEVGLVQTPHHFYNPDIFQRNLRLGERVVNEQNLFFQVVQPGRDGHNSVFFCGSGGVFRRSALDAVGGFATSTVTEDIHTTLLLHAKGYRSVYVRQRLAAGLAPEDCASYVRQRQRWARGHIQMLLSRQSPLFVPGLTMAQRIDYFASIYYFLFGPARVLFLVGPLAYLLLGRFIVMTDVASLLTFYVAHYVGAVLSTGMLTRGVRNPFWADLYETMMSVPLTVTTVATTLLRRPWAFIVTPKGTRSPQHRWDLVRGAPYAVLTAALLAGVGLGGVEVYRAGLSSPALTVSLVWGCYNAALCAAAFVVTRERPQRRNADRLAADHPCDLMVAGSVLPARVIDISESGVQIALYPPRALPRRVDVRLWTERDPELFAGIVVRNDRVNEGESIVGIDFRELTEVQRDVLSRRVYASPAHWERWQAAETGMWSSIGTLATAVFRPFGRERYARRIAPRFTLAIPCELVFRDTIVSGVTEDLSENGLLIRLPLMDESIPETCVIRLIPGMDVYTIRGRIVWRQARTAGGYVGVRCEEPVSRFLISWIDFSQRITTEGNSLPTSVG